MYTAVQKCPYKNCKLKCKSEAHHRAIYSTVQEKYNKIIVKSKKINYEKLQEYLRSSDE